MPHPVTVSLRNFSSNESKFQFKVSSRTLFLSLSLKSLIKLKTVNINTSTGSYMVHIPHGSNSQIEDLKNGI